ncbi:MAG: preprotein translocase subunit SecG [Sedimentisphaerales bacterium]|nr:preprotein translocase subunit SecG [Sedimentisphaerales bacterium]
MMLPLAAISLFWHAMIVLWVLIAIALIVVVLLQKGRGGGLAAAFGGAGASSLLGTRTGDFLTWLTIGLTAAWLLMTVCMGMFMRPSDSMDLLAPSQTPASTAPATTGSEQPAPAATTETPAPAAQPTEQPATPAQPAAEQPEAPAGNEAAQ